MPEVDFGKFLNKKEEIVPVPIAPRSSESSTKTEIKKPRITTENLQKQIDQLKKDLKILKQEGIQEKEELFIPSLHELNVCYKSLCRVIRQLSGNRRSSDYKKEAILVKKTLQTYLIKKGIINGSV